MADLGLFLRILKDVFIFLLKLTWDVVNLALWLAAWAAPWRIPTIVHIFFGKEDGSIRKRLRRQGLPQLARTVADLIVVPLGIASLVLPWRILPNVTGLIRAFPKRSDRLGWNSHIRGVLGLSFLITLLDVILAPFHVLAFVGCVHTAEAVKAVRSTWNRDEHKLPVAANLSMRGEVGRLGLLTVLDAVFIPFFAVVILSWYRYRTTLDRMEQLKSHQVRRRMVVLKQCFLIVVDLPFLVLGAALIVLVWPAGPLIAELKRRDRASKRRLAVVKHLLMFLRDIPFFAFFAVLLGTLVRALDVVARLVRSGKRADSEPPLLQIHAFRPEFRASGPVEMRFTARKPTEGADSPVQSASVWLIAAPDTWTNVGRRIGSAKVQIAQALIPMKLDSSVMDFTPLHDAQPGEDFTLVLHLPADARIPNLIARMRHSGPLEFCIQVDYANAAGHQGVLFSFLAQLSSFLPPQYWERERNQAAAAADDDAEQAAADADADLVSPTTDNPSIGFSASLLEAPWKPSAASGETTWDIDALAEAVANGKATHRFPALPPASAGAGDAEPAFDFGPGRHVEYLSQRESLFDAAFDENALAPFQERFWKVVGAEFVQLVLDVLYFVMFCCTVLAPWRLLGSVVVLLESHQRWHLRVASKLLELTCITRWYRAAFYEQIDDAMEAALKSSADFSSASDGPLGSLSDAISSKHSNIWASSVKPHRFWKDSLTAGLLERVPRHQDLADTDALLQGYWKAEAEEVQAFALPFAAGRLRERQLERANSTAAPMSETEFAAALRAGRRINLKASEATSAAYEAVQARSREIKASLGCFRPNPCAIFARSAGENRDIVQSMFVGGLMDLGAIFGFFLLLGTLYRAMDVIKGLKSAKGPWEFKRIVILKHLEEVFADVLTIVQASFVFATFYNAFDMFSDVAETWIETGSVLRVRSIVHSYFRSLLKDLWDALSWLLFWKTYKFALATVLYGLFVPAAALSESLESVLSTHKIIRRLLALALWGGLFSFPFVFVYGLVPGAQSVSAAGDPFAISASNGDTLQFAMAVFFGALFLAIVLSLIAASREQSFRSVPDPSATVALSWQNANVLLLILIEAVQLSALVFLVLGVSADLPSILTPSVPGVTAGDGAPNPLKASLPVPQPLNDLFGSFHSTLTSLAQSVLFLGDATFLAFGWATVGAVGLWFFVISAPTVLEEVLEWRQKGSISGKKWWEAASALLGQTLYISVIVNLIKPSLCLYIDGRSPFLAYHESLECWKGTSSDQSVLAVTSLFALVFYVLTAHVVPAESGMVRSNQYSTLDVRFPLFYTLVNNTSKVFITTMVFLLLERPWAALVVIAVVSIGMAVFTLAYRSVFDASACCIQWVVALRVGGSLFVAWTALVGLVRLYQIDGDDVTGKLPEDTFWARIDTGIVLVAGWGVIVLVTLIRSAVVSIRVRRNLDRYNERQHARDAVKLLLEAESLLSTLAQKPKDSLLDPLGPDSRALKPEWGGQRSRHVKGLLQPNISFQAQMIEYDFNVSVSRSWQRKVRAASSRTALARLVLRFEEAIRAEALLLGFLKNRTRWLEKLDPQATHFELRKERKGRSVAAREAEEALRAELSYRAPLPDTEEPSSAGQDSSGSATGISLAEIPKGRSSASTSPPVLQTQASSAVPKLEELSSAVRQLVEGIRAVQEFQSQLEPDAHEVSVAVDPADEKESSDAPAGAAGRDLGSELEQSMALTKVFVELLSRGNTNQLSSETELFCAAVRSLRSAFEDLP